MARRIAVIVGSLRKESWTRKIAKAAMAVAPSSLELEIVEIGDLPLYNQDLDDNKTPPAQWTAFRDRMKTFDAVLFATPEYNRSVPAPLKNAIDVGSRPYGSSIWEGKAGAVLSVSPGVLGGFGANQAVRQSFVFLNVPIMQMPEAYIGAVASKFSDKGELDAGTREFLQKFMSAFAEWVERILQR